VPFSGTSSCIPLEVLPNIQEKQACQRIFPSHPNLTALTKFVGHWRGKGRGSYPTIQPFEYNEELTFGHVGKPFLSYTQKTSNLQNGTPLHTEVGFFRVPSPPKIEFVNVQPTGVCEIEEGVIDSNGFIVNSKSIIRTSSAKEPHVTQVTRRFELLNDDTLKVTLGMATTTTPNLTPHLESILHRVE